METYKTESEEIGTIGMNEALQRIHTYANGGLTRLPLGRTSPTQQRGRDRGQSAARFKRQGIPGYGFRQ